MTSLHYACAVRVGREAEVVEELAQVASWAWVAMHMRPVLTGPRNNRQREWRETPMWPGYVFAKMSADQFFASRTIKHLHPTKLALYEAERKALMQAVARVDAALAADRKRIAQEDAPPVTFEAGQRVEVMDGLFAGRLASFASAVRKSDGRYFATVEIDGATVPVQMPAGDLRAAE